MEGILYGSKERACAAVEEGRLKMPKTKLCEDKEKRRLDYIKKLIVGGMDGKSYEEINKKTGIPVQTLKNYIGPKGSLSKTPLERVYKLADVAGVTISVALKDAPN